MSTAQRKKRNRLDNDDEEEEEEEEEDSPKRLRGGGGGGFGGIGDDDDAGGDDLYDDGDYDDAFPMMEHPGEEDEDDDMMGDVAFGDITDAHRSRWSRPAVPSHAWNASDHDLNLQWLDIDMIGGRPLTSNPHLSKKVLGASTGTVPVIRLYGVNETGNSVAVFIHGFTSYGYFAMPRGYAIDGGDENLGRVRSTLDEILRSKLGSEVTNSNKGGGGGGGSSSSSSSADGGEPPRAVLGVTRVSDKRSIMGYDPSHTSFLKVYVAMPGFLPKLKTIMEEGMRLTGVTRDNGGGADGDDDERREVRETVIYQPFECNVPYVMRYMIDRDITGASWLTLPKGTYRLRRTESEKGTHCQVSFIHSFILLLLLLLPKKPRRNILHCVRPSTCCRLPHLFSSRIFEPPPKKQKPRTDRGGHLLQRNRPAQAGGGMVEGGAAAHTFVRHRMPGSQGVLPRGRTRSGHTNRELDQRVRRRGGGETGGAERVHPRGLPPHSGGAGHIEQYRGGHAPQVADVRARVRRGHIHGLQRSGDFVACCRVVMHCFLLRCDTLTPSHTRIFFNTFIIEIFRRMHDMRRTSIYRISSTVPRRYGRRRIRNCASSPSGDASRTPRLGRGRRCSNRPRTAVVPTPKPLSRVE